MTELDLLALDRDIRRAAKQERAWLRSLRTDASTAADDAWFEPVRHVTTRTTFQAVSSLSPDDPFREPMRRWVYRLAITRIAQPALARAASARQAPQVILDVPDAGTYSARDLVHRALGEPDLGRRRLWVDALAAAATPVAAAEQQAHEAVLEIGLRLGADDPATLWPYDASALRDAATEVLKKTSELARAAFAASEDWATLLATLVARDVAGVWPGGSLARWAVEQFRATPLFEGIALDLGPVPTAFGASSFARALARVGAAYARAAPATGSTFVHAHDPNELGSLRRGALFAGLLAEPAFLRARVGLSPRAVAGAARAMALTFLAWVRLEATRALVNFAVASPSDAQEWLQNALHVAMPRALGGIMPRASSRAPHAFAAALLGRADAMSLRDRFDEDWFRNPHALRQMRAEDAAPYAPRLAGDAFAGAPARMAAWLESLVG
jgi:hypothetical protein